MTLRALTSVVLLLLLVPAKTGENHWSVTDHHYTPPETTARISGGSSPLGTTPISAAENQKQSTKTAARVPVQESQRIKATLAKGPLTFEVNRGQTDPQVKFLSRGRGYTLFLTANEAVLSLQRPSSISTVSPPLMRDTAASYGLFKSPAGVFHRNPTERDYPAASTPEVEALAVFRMKLVGANANPKVEGLERLPGKSNYFIGKDPRNWRTKVPNFAKVKYKNAYPGIDLIYYGNQRQLEYDFVVAPGANSGLICLGIHGANSLKLDSEGDLVVHAPGGEVTLRAPTVYQELNGAKERVSARYVLKDMTQVGFEVDRYDITKPLIIDPVLAYSTYLGGSSGDGGSGIAVDPSGNAYVAGVAGSLDFPTTAGAFQTDGGGCFVTKLNATGSELIYSTLINDAGCLAIAVDGVGNAYVTGNAGSGLPITSGAAQASFGGGDSDAFVAVLNPTGSALIYCTYLGGSGIESGSGIAVDASGNAYLAGRTVSTDFPTTAGALKTSCTPSFENTCTDTGAFVMKLNAAGSQFVYSTYFPAAIVIEGIALDNSGNAYVIGSASVGLPTTEGAFQTSCAPSPFGCRDAFVAKLDAVGSALSYCTYVGGNGTIEDGQGIAVDSSGSAYLVGETNSSDFPTTPLAFDRTCGTDGNCDLSIRPDGRDAFVTKLNPTGSALAYSTYLGGSSLELFAQIALDMLGNAYVVGHTGSFDFPVVNAIQSECTPTSGAGCGDVFVVKLNSTGSALTFSTYLGGSGGNELARIAVGQGGDAYVVGLTDSTDFPTSDGAFDRTCGTDGNCNPNPLGALSYDAFVAKISTSAGPAPEIISVSPISGTQGETISNFTINGSNFAAAATLSFSGTGITVNSYSSRTSTQIVASITIANDAPTGLRDVIVTNPDSQQATLSAAFTIIAVPPPPPPPPPETGTIELSPSCAGPGVSVTLTGTGWVTIPEEAEYRFFFGDAQVAQQGPDVGLSEQPNVSFIVPDGILLANNSIVVELRRTADQTIIQSKRTLFCQLRMKLQKGQFFIEPGNNYSENVGLKAALIFPPGHPNAGDTVVDFSGMVVFDEDPSTNYYDGENGASLLPTTAQAQEGVAKIILKSVSNSNDPAGPIDAKIIATAPAVAPDPATNPLSVDQWVDESRNGLIDWLEKHSDEVLRCSRRVGDEAKKIADKVKEILQDPGVGPEGPQCGSTPLLDTKATKISIAISPVCGSPNEHRLNVNNGLSITVLHESRHAWQNTERFRKVGVDDDGLSETPRNDDDSDLLLEEVAFISADLITEAVNGTGDSSFDADIDDAEKPAGKKQWEIDAENFGITNAGLCR